MDDRDQRTVFVTGATGYIGGRLVPRLVEAGYRVRCLARSPKKLDNRAWTDHPSVEIVAGDVGDPEGLADAMRGCGVAYYMVHSMVAVGSSYAERDRELARNFAAAAEAAGCERIVYLGGLGETGAGLSEHLSSRREVERALAGGSVPVTVLRAAMIIGSGSASFEILRYLVERLPIMVTPRWVSTECQPIAVRNVLHYLIEVIETPETADRVLDIGGPEAVTYLELMQTYAAAAGLRKRIIVPVPVLTPRLSSLWIHLVTPLDAQIARPLAEGLRNRVVCRNDQAARLMPQELLSTRQAIDESLGMDHPETSWSDAGTIPGDPDWAGGTSYVHREETEVDGAAADVFRAVVRIGGKNGWYGVDSLWRVRGWIDQLLSWRSRSAPRPARRRHRALRRRAGLLAGDRHRGGKEARAAGRDDRSRRRDPRVRDRAERDGRWRLPSRPDRPLPAPRPARHPLLVCGDAAARDGLPAHAAGHPPRGRARCRRGARNGDGSACGCATARRTLAARRPGEESACSPHILTVLGLGVAESLLE
jgi:uncharacterized protein YbjT (DUF2867 family)